MQRIKPNPRYAYSAQSIVKEGADEIADITNLKRRTVHAILHRFKERGIGGKDNIKQGGRPSYLTIKQRKELVKQLQSGSSRNKTGLWSTKEVRDYIKKEYDVTYTSGYVWEVLKALGFSLQRSWLSHRKASDAKAGDRFKKRLSGWHALIDEEYL